MTNSALLYEQSGPVGWINLNRPNEMNAINLQMLDEFEEILISSRAPNQRVVNSFRHHNVHYEDRIAVGLDDYDEAAQAC